jgi:peptidoglycan/LPS O-acetylase OafA/YrhL
VLDLVQHMACDDRLDGVEATNYRFFPFELSLFLYGSLCFRIGRLLPQFDARWSAAIAAAAILTLAFPPRYFVEHQYQLYAVVGAILPALFGFSQRNSWDRSLGDLSYPLYLVHWPIVIFGSALLGSAQPGSIRIVVAYPIILVAFAIVCSIAIDRYVVVPIDKWRQLRVASPQIIDNGIDLRKTPANI